MKVAACWLVAAAGLLAAGPAFETAVIRSNKSGERGFGLAPPRDGRFIARNAPLDALIREAWHLQSFQLSGPPWLSSERFDITAKTGGDRSPRQVMEMLQTLLTERFAMQIHHETKEMAVYHLTAARGGVKMARSVGTCPEKPDPNHPCGGFNIRKTGLLAGYNIGLDQMTEALSFILGRMVIDQTGLEGRFDADIRWTPDEFNQETGLPAPAADLAGQSLFNVLQEKLGLRLQATRGAVDVLVIDRANRTPSEN
jgi:uncharacterized protein (TIGR03435 family)